MRAKRIAWVQQCVPVLEVCWPKQAQIIADAPCMSNSMTEDNLYLSWQSRVSVLHIHWCHQNKSNVNMLKNTKINSTICLSLLTLTLKSATPIWFPIAVAITLKHCAVHWHNSNTAFDNVCCIPHHESRAAHFPTDQLVFCCIKACTTINI